MVRRDPSLTAIEGNTLVLREAAPSMKVAVGEKELREYLEVQGYGDAAQWTTNKRTAPVFGLMLISLRLPNSERFTSKRSDPSGCTFPRPNTTPARVRDPFVAMTSRHSREE